jgi:integrase
MGVRDDGGPDRRHVRGKDKAAVTAKVQKLERQRDEGIVAKPGRAWTAEKWLTHWLEIIARPSVRYKTYVGYRTAVHRHLIPGIGGHRLGRLEPEHLDKLYARIQASGLKPGTAHQVHRTARTALGEAFKRRRIPLNPPSSPSRRESRKRKSSRSRPRTSTDCCERHWPGATASGSWSRWRSVSGKAKRWA